MIEKVQESHLYMWLKEKDSKFLSKLDETIEYANTILPQINNVFASYTVHGVRHSINVMEYMYALVVDINKLSELEVALLIYSALLHDIGMIANVDEIKEIMNQLKLSTVSVKLPAISQLGEDHVTLSQGCCNRIPEPLNRLWDYLARADTVLYDVKKKGKNNYKVSERFKKA